MGGGYNLPPGLGALSWAWLGVMPRTLQTRRGGEPGMPQFPLRLCLLPPG